MQYQQKFFYTSFNFSATTTYHEGQLKKMNDFLKMFSQIHLWITENRDNHVVIKVQIIISNWSKMFPKRSFEKKFQNSSESILSPVLKKSQKVPSKNLEQPKKRPKPK